MKTVHSAHGNNLPTPRRAFSTRWLGDDAVKGDRPWMNLPPSNEMKDLKKGDKLVDSGAFTPRLGRIRDNLLQFYNLIESTATAEGR